MRIERVKNFLTPEECAELNAWTDLGVENKWLDSGTNSLDSEPFKKRVTSRMYVSRYTYPDIVHKISDKVRAFCGVAAYPLIADGHGRDGVVVSCTFPGGDVYEHLDLRSAETNTPTLRCNILTRSADSGGVLHIEQQPIDVEVGELHCYLVSEHRHHVSVVQGSTSRVMWMFGAQVPADDWDSGFIKIGG